MWRLGLLFSRVRVSYLPSRFGTCSLLCITAFQGSPHASPCVVTTPHCAPRVRNNSTSKHKLALIILIRGMSRVLKSLHAIVTACFTILHPSSLEAAAISEQGSWKHMAPRQPTVFISQRTANKIDTYTQSQLEDTLLKL